MIEITYGLILLSVLLTLTTAYFWRKSRIQKKRPESIELREFLRDMMSGDALIHVRRIDPVDVILRQRRQ